MAQLDIERKPGTSMGWLWLLIALLVILAIWWFVWGARGERGVAAVSPADSAAAVARARDTTAMRGAAAPPAAAVMGTAGAVNSFVSFVSDSRSDTMAVTHAHTATGLRDLAAAGEALALSLAGAPSVTARADSLRTMAGQLESDSTQAAGIVRRAFVVGANMLHQLRPADSMAVAGKDNLMRAAEAIAPGTPLLRQRQAVQHYWDVAAAEMTRMGGNRR